MNDIEKRLAALPPEKRKLFLQQLNREFAKVEKSDTQQILPQIRDTDTFPLSYSQQRLWFLDQLEPGNVAYNIPLAIRFKGRIDLLALEKSLNEIVHRHEALRTTFTKIQDKPFQVIHPPEKHIIELIDLQSISRARQDAKVKELISDEALRPFNLTQGPLLRTTLLKLDAEDFVFLVTMHHVISDGWSMGLFMGELRSYYDACSTGQVPALPELPIQYVDFSKWQQEWLRGDVLESQLRYWKTKLDALPPNLELPIDYARPKTQTFNGAKETLELSESLTEALKAISRQEGCTLFMTMLAAFNILLYRQTGQKDIVIGTPIAGRNRAELEKIIGLFLNTLVLRVNLDGNPGFRELLEQVREVSLAAFANQDIPFEKLLEEIHPERDLSRTPIFQILFNMLNFNEDSIDLHGLTGEFISRADEQSKFDLTLYIAEQKKKVQLILVYNAELFSRARMSEFIRQLAKLLQQIAENPDQSIDTYSLLTPQAQQILPNPSQPLGNEWNGSIPDRFVQHANRLPGQTAIIDQHGSWSYHDLDELSNRLANYLCINGVQPGDPVAVYAHRSASLVLALMSIFKAGAAFVILDPAYPAAQLIDRLQMARPVAFLQLEEAGRPTPALENYLASSSFACRIILPYTLDQIREFLKACGPEALHVVIHPDQLAYIAFTSGSTGRPKGILGNHRALSNFLDWHGRTFELIAHEHFSMLSGLAHDPLLRDIFTPLWLGATLCVPSQTVIETPGRLGAWLQQHQITVTHITPAMSELLVEGNTKQLTLNALRFAFFAGDALTWQHISLMRELAPGVTCVNFYGATETPQAMSFNIVDFPNLHQGESSSHTEDSSRQMKIPIGKGRTDVQLLLLNTVQQLAGIGELGEIYIRSAYLARGYLDDDALTQERFIVNPITQLPDDRLYRTGDLGRYLPDGNIEFLGRHDQQVKVRGFRVELGEIEVALRQHPSVQDTIVVAHEIERTPGQSQIAAFIVLHPKQQFDISELRSFLAERLPRYAIPAAFVAIEALPLTPNGKVDRRALPKPETLAGENHAYVPPRTPTEEAIAMTWSQVLNVEQVGVHDDFFELGGHSLLAAQVIARLRDKLKIELPLRNIFEAPTVAELAERLDAVIWAVQTQSDKPNLEGDDREVFEL